MARRPSLEHFSVLSTLCLLAFIPTSAVAEYYFGAGDSLSHDGYVSDGDSYMSDGDVYQEHWPMDSAMFGGQPGAHHGAKCIDIPSNLTLCQNIRYTQMRLPNLLKHDSIREVTSQAKSWVPLVGIGCHRDTKLFLCSLFSPVCLDRPIWPCRSLCNSVKDACETHMNAHGFSWPDMLKCDQFPLDNDLCIGLQNDMKPDEKKCEACNKPATFESIIHNYCTSDFVAKVKIMENVIVDGMTRLTAHKKKRKVFKAGQWTKAEQKQPVAYIEQGSECDCSSLDDPRNEDASFLVMGKVQDGKHVIKYLQLFDKRSKILKKAFREIRKGHICEDGVKALTSSQAQGTDAQTPLQPKPVEPVEVHVELEVPTTTTNMPDRRLGRQGRRRQDRRNNRKEERANRKRQRKNGNNKYENGNGARKRKGRAQGNDDQLTQRRY